MIEERLSCWLFFGGGGLFINVPCHKRRPPHCTEQKKTIPRQENKHTHPYTPTHTLFYQNNKTIDTTVIEILTDILSPTAFCDIDISLLLASAVVVSVVPAEGVAAPVAPKVRDVVSVVVVSVVPAGDELVGSGETGDSVTEVTSLQTLDSPK